MCVNIHYILQKPYLELISLVSYTIDRCFI